jgi:hypothetical protein
MNALDNILQKYVTKYVTIHTTNYYALYIKNYKTYLKDKEQMKGFSVHTSSLAYDAESRERLKFWDNLVFYKANAINKKGWWLVDVINDSFSYIHIDTLMKNL